MVRTAVTPERLREAGGKAGERVRLFKGKELKTDLPEGLVKCEYLGTEEDGAPLLGREKRGVVYVFSHPGGVRVLPAPRLRCLTRVRFQWSAGHLGSIVQTVSASRALHHLGIAPPWDFRFPLLVASLPPVIAKRRLVPGMVPHEEVACRALAIPKPYEKELEVTVGERDGRRQEFLKCAPVSGRTWLP